MRSGICAFLVLISAGFAVSCGSTRTQQVPEARDLDEAAAARERALAVAQASLARVDGYEVGVATLRQFREDGWPSFTVLHMDVRAGPVETANAVAVLGVAGGAATAGDSAERLVAAALAQSDGRGLCIVRGWFEGQRRIAALPTECPRQIRDELDAILGDIDDLTGGDAVWLLGFEQGVLRRKQHL